MAALDTIPFRAVLWLVPVFFTLHNVEEAPFMSKWGKRLPVKFFANLTTPQFVVALAFLTLTSYILTYACLTRLPASTGSLLILGIQLILFVNAFVPHLATTLRLRLYSSGVVTAVLVNIPFSVYLFQRAFAEEINRKWGQFWMMLGIAPFAMITLTVLSLQLGKVLTRKPNFCTRQKHVEQPF